MTSSHYGARRAINELTAICEAQWANGLLPQIRFVPGQSGYRPDAEDWGVTPAIAGHARVATSGITQPPIIGLCAHEVFCHCPEREGHLAEFLTLADSLERYHHFLLTARDPFGDDLVVCFHSWETGTDNSPAFEPLLAQTRVYLAEHHIPVDTFGRADTLYVQAEHRPTANDYVAYFGLLSLFKQCQYDQARIAATTPFLLQDVLFNCLLVASLDALAKLEDELAELVSTDHGANLRQRAAANRAARDRVAAAIRDKLWSEADGLYYARDARRGELIRVPTVSSLMPLLAGIASPAQATRLIEHLLNADEFWTPCPVPSTAANHAGFNPQRYWTGPSWPVTNWLLVRALAAHHPDVAERLRALTLSMIVAGDPNLSRWRERAAQVMDFNSIGERVTTPSRHQYQHAWLWDSAVAALGWMRVAKKPAPFDPGSDGPHFAEYFHPFSGAPLGAPLMTWTAAVFLDLLAGDR